MDLFDLTGKVAVVTGGTRGIGLMMARGLLQAGAATVYVSSRNADAGDAAVAELSAFGRAVPVPADLSQESECLRLAAEVGLAEERIHILVNNARRRLGRGPGRLSRVGLGQGPGPEPEGAVLPHPGVPAAAGGGRHFDDPARVINVGSIDALRVPDVHNYSYAASKAGLHQLTRVLARELGPRHITVNAVAPGPLNPR